MFGNTSDIRKETENDKKIEPCYGGFRGRFSYELLRSKKRRAKLAGLVPRIATIAVSCLLFGALGILCGVMMFNVVQGEFPQYQNMIFRYGDNGTAKEATNSVSVLSSVNVDAKMENVTKGHSERYRVPVGVLIRELSKDNAGYTAGIRPGDIVVRVNNVAVISISELEAIIDAHDPNTSLSVRVFRDGKYYDFSFLNK